MHTQTDTAQQIIDSGGDYVFTVKGNQPNLFAACKQLPWKDVPSHTVTSNGKKTIEVVYLITSADHRAAPPATLAAWVQGHWGIENRLHWVRDVSFDEDRSQVRTGNSPHVMATLRSTAISLLRLTGVQNIAQALRHHAREPETVVKLILTC